MDGMEVIYPSPLFIDRSPLERQSKKKSDYFVSQFEQLQEDNSNFQMTLPMDSKSSPALSFSSFTFTQISSKNPALHTIPIQPLLVKESSPRGIKSNRNWEGIDSVSTFEIITVPFMLFP